MEKENSLNYESVAMLIGKTVLQNQFQLEQLGKAMAASQEQLNRAREEIVMLRQELAQVKNEQRVSSK